MICSSVARGQPARWYPRKKIFVLLISLCRAPASRRSLVEPPRRLTALPFKSWALMHRPCPWRPVKRKSVRLVILFVIQFPLVLVCLNHRPKWPRWRGDIAWDLSGGRSGNRLGFFRWPLRRSPSIFGIALGVSEHVPRHLPFKIPGDLDIRSKAMERHVMAPQGGVTKGVRNRHPKWVYKRYGCTLLCVYEED